MPAIALGGIGAASPTVDKRALRLAKGDISVKSVVPLNQQLFIYSINRHLMKIQSDRLGEVLEKNA